VSGVSRKWSSVEGQQEKPSAGNGREPESTGGAGGTRSYRGRPFILATALNSGRNVYRLSKCACARSAIDTCSAAFDLAEPVAPCDIVRILDRWNRPYCIEDRQAMADEFLSSATGSASGSTGSASRATAAGTSAPLAHIVFFTLAESNDANRLKLIEACKKYLDGHEGVVYFGVGVRAPECDRAVNDRDYDVALHLVFASAKDQDVYQTHPRHLKFVEECQGMWKQVRVFDSRLG
jgi:hypothetical protein